MFFNENEDYYKILNVKNNATQDEIKSAYKELIKIYHPDINKDKDSEIKFREILKSYTILSDCELRKQYDNFLEIDSKKRFKYNTYKFIQRKDIIFKKINIFFKNIYNKINKKVYINDIEDFFLSKINNVDNINIEEIELRLKYSQNEYLRSIAAIILGYKQDKKYAFLLENALNDESLEVRLCSIWALGNLGMKKSINKLKEIYKKSNTRLKIISLYSIFKISRGNPLICNDVIKDALNDDNEELKEFAKNLYFYIKNEKNYIKIDNESQYILNNEKVIFANLNYPNG